MVVEVVLWVVILLVFIEFVCFMATVKIMLDHIMLLRADHADFLMEIRKLVFEHKMMERQIAEMDK